MCGKLQRSCDECKAGWGSKKSVVGGQRAGPAGLQLRVVYACPYECMHVFMSDAAQAPLCASAGRCRRRQPYAAALPAWPPARSRRLQWPTRLRHPSSA